jgi:hypothetical protein
VPFISVTRLRIRSPRFLPQFFWYALRSQLQAKRAPGSLGVRVLNEARSTFWTCTAWTDESAMRAFMISGAHKRAMQRLLHWCDEASVVHWTQSTSELPGWPEAYRRMVNEGRPSKVNHPSPAHLAREIPPVRP